MDLIGSELDFIGPELNFIESAPIYWFRASSYLSRDWVPIFWSRAWFCWLGPQFYWRRALIYWLSVGNVRNVNAFMGLHRRFIVLRTFNAKLRMHSSYFVRCLWYLDSVLKLIHEFGNSIINMHCLISWTNKFQFRTQNLDSIGILQSMNCVFSIAH